ncbi:MAG: hypothetical protein CMJ94_04100 [Planctomycetes bacterium]|nr:hypothetical protein [Planctomycetota bacterium]
MRELRKRRREALEKVDKPTLVRGPHEWAFRPRFIRAGSHLFDEVFRLALGLGLGFCLGAIVSDSWRYWGVGGLTTVIFLALMAAATGIVVSLPVCLIYLQVRKPSLKKRRLPGQPPPPALRYVGRTALAVGFGLWFLVRAGLLRLAEGVA